MGGIGSGRPPGFASSVDSTRRVDIRYMRKQGILKPGWRGEFHWSRNGERTASINYRVESDRVILSFRHRFRGGGDWQDAEQHILLSETPCHFGGVRQWFHCPGCHRRCEVLCGADALFLCRQCHRLPYQTQLENKHGRAVIKRNNLREKLYGDNRPRMWTKTRMRLTNEYRQATAAADRELLACCERLGILPYSVTVDEC